MISALKVSPVAFGDTMNAHTHFINRLCYSVPQLKILDEFSVNECDVIVAFVPIVSRAGTDVQAALKRIHQLPNKPVIMVCLHHTFDPQYIPPDVRSVIPRDQVFPVNCLFHEDQGLLNCWCNDDALRAVAQRLQGQTLDPMHPISHLNTLTARPSWSQQQGGTTDDLVSWIFIVLSILAVWVFLPDGYSNQNFIIFQILLLLVVSVALSYFNRSKMIGWVVVIVNILLLVFIFLV